MKKVTVFMFLMSLAINAVGSEKESISCLEGKPIDYQARLDIEETITGRLEGLGGFNGALNARFICDDDIQAGKILCAGLLDKLTGAGDRFVRIEISRKNMIAVMQTTERSSELECSSSVR
ncbi:MAG: hypothetical protein V4596_00450 [Bdellovibrionota bacterium]